MRQLGILAVGGAVLIGFVAVAIGSLSLAAAAEPIAQAAAPIASPTGAPTNVPPTSAPTSTAQPPAATSTTAPAQSPTNTPTVAVNTPTAVVNTPTTRPPTTTPSPTVAATVAAQPTLDAASPTAAPVAGGSVSYSRNVQPILNRICVKCHGGEETKEGLSLKSYADLMAGSNNGPVLTPGDVANSFLIEQIVNGKMPKQGPKLLPAEIRTLSDWVAAGALNN